MRACVQLSALVAVHRRLKYGSHSCDSSVCNVVRHYHSDHAFLLQTLCCWIQLLRISRQRVPAGRRGMPLPRLCKYDLGWGFLPFRCISNHDRGRFRALLRQEPSVCTQPVVTSAEYAAASCAAVVATDVATPCIAAFAPTTARDNVQRL